MTACGGAEEKGDRESIRDTDGKCSRDGNAAGDRRKKQSQKRKRRAKTETAAQTEKATEKQQRNQKLCMWSAMYISARQRRFFKAVAVAHLGDEVTAVPEDGKWCKVKLGDKRRLCGERLPDRFQRRGRPGSKV